MTPPLFRPGHERKISTDLKTKRLFEHAVDFIRLRVRLSLIPVAQTGQAIVLGQESHGIYIIQHEWERNCL